MSVRGRMVVIAGVLVCILAGGGWLASIFLNVDRYRPQITAYFEESTGKKVEIGHLAFSLLPKATIHIEGFSVKSPPLFPPSYILRVPRADAVVDFWPLLQHRVIIRSLILEAPEINLVSDPDGPWNFENPNSSNSKNLFPLAVIDKLEMHRGQLLISNLLPSDAAGPVFFEAHEIDSDMQRVDLAAIVNPASPALNGQGSWTAQRLRFGAVVATDVHSKFHLQSREIFFTEMAAKVYGGKGTGNFSVSLAKRTPSFKADARMSGINVAGLLASFHETRGLLTGDLEGNLKLSGAIEHTANPLAHLHGAGRIKVTSGQVPSLKLNANLMKLAHFNDLGPAKENPAAFSSISTDLELENLHINSKAIDIDGYGVDVDGSGNVSVSGSDDLNYQGVATITTKQGFLTNTFARFAGAKMVDGKLTFPFRITGTVEAPQFFKGAAPAATK
jgi:uncharacterized protein involved in outer membrane biogenesis